MLANEAATVNSAAPPTTPCSPELPEVLRPGGTVDVLLEEARQNGNGTENLRLLKEKIQCDLRVIRTAYLDVASRLDLETASATEIVVRVINTQLSIQDFDPLLLVSLARLTQVKLGQQWLAKAVRACRDKSELYTAVLGSLMPEEIRCEADRQLAREAFHDGTNPTAADDLDAFCDLFDQDARRPSQGLTCSTGLSSLDNSLNGIDGITFVAGTKGVGKTTLMILMMLAALEGDPDLVVVFFTLDLNKMRLIERLICHVAGVDYRTLKRKGLGDNTSPEIKAAVAHVGDNILSRVRFVERKNLPRDGSWRPILFGNANRLLAHTGTHKLLVIIDPFQRMHVPPQLWAGGDNEESVAIPLNSEGARDDYRLDAIKEFRDGFRTLQQPNGPPIIIASEIPKRDNSRRDLTVDDLRGSGRMASDADNILLLMPTKEIFDGADSVSVTLRIAKGRDGVIRRDIPLNFHHTRSQFEEVNRAHRDPRSASTTSQNQDTRATEPQVDPLADG